MKKSTVTIMLAAAAAFAVSGCSSFNVGAACYIPHGVSGQCTAATMAPSTVPAAARVAPQPAAAPKPPAPGA